MRGRWLALMAAVLFASVPLALAQRGMRNYDPSTETTVKGAVEEVKQVTGKHGWNGTHLMLKTEAGQLDVHVGPLSYVAGRGFTFAKGDQVEVLGSKVKMGGSEALIAREIKKGDKTLVLRNAQGIPEWSGGRQRPQ
jgi:DNA/RNA endonuclease YhcR with UshA esterase domain